MIESTRKKEDVVMAIQTQNKLTAAFRTIGQRLRSAKPCPCWTEYMRETRD